MNIVGDLCQDSTEELIGGNLVLVFTSRSLLFYACSGNDNRGKNIGSCQQHNRVNLGSPASGCITGKQYDIFWDNTSDFFACSWSLSP